MRYRLRYAEKAADQLRRLPAGLVSGVEYFLRRLSETPTAVSVRIASPPFPPRGQLYQFTASDGGGERWFFTVIFQYSQDETALYVLSVTWRELDN